MLLTEVKDRKLPNECSIFIFLGCIFMHTFLVFLTLSDCTFTLHFPKAWDSGRWFHWSAITWGTDEAECQNHLSTFSKTHFELSPCGLLMLLERQMYLHFNIDFVCIYWYTLSKTDRRMCSQNQLFAHLLWCHHSLIIAHTINTELLLLWLTSSRVH